MELQKVYVGVLAIQGGFFEHVRSLKQAAANLNLKTKSFEAEVFELRDLKQINEDLDGLIVPGGESTVMRKYLKEHDFQEKLAAWTRIESKFTWGTCAGLILLSNRIKDDEAIIGGLDITCSRNAFGRQVDSFEAPLSIVDSELENTADSSVVPGIFIRAPRIFSIDSKQVTVMCRLPDEVQSDNYDRAVGVRQGNVMACSFHPELSSDLSWHKYFLKQVVSHKYTPVK